MPLMVMLLKSDACLGSQVVKLASLCRVTCASVMCVLHAPLCCTACLQPLHTVAALHRIAGSELSSGWFRAIDIAPSAIGCFRARLNSKSSSSTSQPKHKRKSAPFSVLRLVLIANNYKASRLLTERSTAPVRSNDRALLLQIPRAHSCSFGLIISAAPDLRPGCCDHLRQSACTGCACHAAWSLRCHQAVRLDSLTTRNCCYISPQQAAYTRQTAAFRQFSAKRVEMRGLCAGCNTQMLARHMQQRIAVQVRLETCAGGPVQ